jgi:dimethylargininase
MTTIAITRKISPRFNECEITHIDRTPIDVKVAEAQHNQYINALQELNCEVIELNAEKDLPDSVFVEDTAFILPEVAVITRPGADSRKPEIETIIQALSPYKKLIQVKEPATVDGGDVLVLGKNIYIGLSTRSTIQAVEQLNTLLKDFGYQVFGIELTDCLHLKSAVTKVDEQTLLINSNWVDANTFASFDLIEVHASEPFGANCLPTGGSIIYPYTYPKTQALLEAKGFKIKNVNLDELAKAEGAVTCCSLILE